MGRIKIDIAGRLLTTVTLAVRITDINYGNHTGNDAFVGLMQEARMAWLHQHNYTELAIEGTGLIMSDLAIEFKNESFYGDVLQIELYAAEVSKVSFELLYQINTQRHGENILVAKAKTGMVCYNYAERKVTSIPENFIKLLI